MSQSPFALSRIEFNLCECVSLIFYPFRHLVHLIAFDTNGQMDKWIFDPFWIQTFGTFDRISHKMDTQDTLFEGDILVRGDTSSREDLLALLQDSSFLWPRGEVMAAKDAQAVLRIKSIYKLILCHRFEIQSSWRNSLRCFIHLMPSRSSLQLRGVSLLPPWELLRRRQAVSDSGKLKVLSKVWRKVFREVAGSGDVDLVLITSRPGNGWDKTTKI